MRFPKCASWDNYLANEVEEHYGRSVECDCCHEAEGTIDIEDYNKKGTYILWEHFFDLRKKWLETTHYLCEDCFDEYFSSMDYLVDRFVAHGYYPENY